MQRLTVPSMNWIAVFIVLLWMSYCHLRKGKLAGTVYMCI